MHSSKRNLNAGFTLVELLVTISIFVILTGIVLFNQQKFNSTILLTNLAYDTALTIRQAQTYGINIKEFDDNNAATTNNFVPYGVHFDDRDDKSFILFADTAFVMGDSPNPYTGAINACSANEGCVNRYSIKRGNRIEELKVIDSGGSEQIVDKLDIVFKRPNPDAIIVGKNGTNVVCSNCTKAKIILHGVSEGQRTVVVQSNGLIEILNN